MYLQGLLDRKKTINLLLVEDSETATVLIRESLEPLGSAFFLHLASTLEEARGWLSSNVPDLVIVDLMLPDGKGTSLLGEDGKPSPFPVVVLTGAGNEVEAVEAIKHGALDYLVKTPEVLADLPRVVERCLREWGHIVRHRLSEAALRESEERFRTIFFTAAAGIVLISPSRRIIQVNPAFCRFTGYQGEELLNRMIDELNHTDDNDRIIAMYDDLFSLRISSLDCERRYLKKDGSYVWGHVSIASVNAVDGTPAYCIALVQDITGRKEMEEKLLLANRELDAFVHTVSHDLRSPLTPILAYVQLLQDQYSAVLDDSAKEMLQEVRRQGERMHSMLVDLLSLATVGGIESPLYPVSCKEVLNEVLLGLSADLSAANVRVEAGDLPALMVPKTLCTQIFDNLLANAIHYAGKGPVEVSGTRNGQAVRLSVRDHGPGVADEEKSSIFELFYRGTSGRKTRGTGIGLATVQKIARRYGGSAWVEDAPGGGSIFNVELLDCAED